MRCRTEVIPAIDLKNGKCVRLYQGDYSRETVFSEEPLSVALSFQSMGAPRLHIVDLDGAATGNLANMDIIKAIVSTLHIPVQVGGGIRELKTMEELLKANVDRIILGTIAVEDPELVANACRRFNDAVVVSIDAREGRVATRGWLQEVNIGAVEFAKSVIELGVKRLIYTDISRDGTLTEPDFSGLARLVAAVPVPVIASGGVAAIEHLKMLKTMGAEGAIIGKALYTGDIDLRQALEAIRKMEERGQPTDA